VRQLHAYYFVAPAHNFDLPKVRRFRDWLREVCQQFPPPEGERLEPQEDTKRC
jgi:LysR family glycine cleavage system transcriptional activator